MTTRFYDRDAALNLWAQGVSAQKISETLDITSATAVMDLVRRARRQGDSRAVRRKAGMTPRVFERDPPIPASMLPDYSNLSPFGFLMGDPPSGRSALDRKRAGLPV